MEKIKYSDIREKIVEKEFYIKEDSFYTLTDVPFETSAERDFALFSFCSFT